MAIICSKTGVKFLLWLPLLRRQSGRAIWLLLASRCARLALLTIQIKLIYFPFAPFLMQPLLIKMGHELFHPDYPY